MLSRLLEEINEHVRKHNAEVDEEVACTRITEADAKSLKHVEEVTKEIVYAAENWMDFPKSLLNILDSTAIRNMDGSSIDTEIHPTEIVRLAKSCKHPTEITRDLCKGAASAKGGKGIEFGGNVQVKLIQLAHLAARAETPETCATS